MKNSFSLGRQRQLRDIDKKMNAAKSYSEWKELAARHDEVSGAELWK